MWMHSRVSIYECRATSDKGGSSCIIVMHKKVSFIQAYERQYKLRAPRCERQSASNRDVCKIRVRASTDESASFYKRVLYFFTSVADIYR
jgi:tRNA(Phe) wybutosine-synthesizing methylase Tyw3